jgi:hypothetical protein
MNLKENVMNALKTNIANAAALALLAGASLLHPAHAGDETGKSEAIADALLAAPPSVTNNARIYGWTSKGELTLVRDGIGPYTCVSSGAFSLRLGKPPLPYPDPMCMDQNGWAFLQAVWSEKDPLHPKKPYPTSPGLVWMLAGMSVQKGAVAIGASETSVVKASPGTAGGEMFQMTPHVMIMPVPFNKSVSKLSTKYDLDNSLNEWIMAAGTPYEHLMVHFSADEVKAMMEAGR